MSKELDEAFTSYDLASRVSTLAKARAASAYQAANIAAYEASVAHKAEIKAADDIYRIAQRNKIERWLSPDFGD